MYDGLISCNCNQPVLKYPVKKNKKWTEKEAGTNYQIIETKKKVKVKAGTFKNVVVVKETTYGSKDFRLLYYAPSNGVILLKYNAVYTNYKTVKGMELIKVKNR